MFTHVAQDLILSSARRRLPSAAERTKDDIAVFASHKHVAEDLIGHVPDE
jgi:hypothetical protein